MNISRILGVLLIVGGALALAYGQFSYTRETHNAELGPIEFEVKDTETVNIPGWAGLAAVGVGLVLVLVRRR